MPRAGLTAESVVTAGAEIADELGYANLNLALVAQRLGVRAPSLYKHLDGLADLQHRIATLAILIVNVPECMIDRGQGEHCASGKCCGAFITPICRNLHANDITGIFARRHSNPILAETLGGPASAVVTFQLFTGKVKQTLLDHQSSHWVDFLDCIQSTQLTIS